MTLRLLLSWALLALFSGCATEGAPGGDPTYPQPQEVKKK
jgi:hypothetical protein